MSHRPGLLALTLAALVGSSALVDAGPALAQSPSPADRMRAGELFQQAEGAIQQQRFLDAAGLYEQAYRLDPRPELVWNAAQAYEAAGHLPGAKVRYEEFLSLPGVAPQHRQIAQGRLDGVDVKLRLEKPKPGQVAPPPLVTAGAPLPTPTPGPATPGGMPTGPAVPTPTPTPPATAGAGAGQGTPSKQIVRSDSADGERPYRVSAMHCRWVGGLGQFQSCSTTHAWGGEANFAVRAGGTRAAGNLLNVAFAESYRRRPYCSVEFEDLVAHRRVEAKEGGVALHLYGATGTSLPWSDVTTWVTIVCHGVD